MGGRGGSSGISKQSKKSQYEHMVWDASSRVENLAKANGISLEEAQEQADALRSYSRAGYRDIRNAQHNREIGTENYQKALAIERFIEQSPNWNGGTIYRSINLTESQKADLSIGSKIDMRGISSWSTKKEKASEFGTTMFIAKGTKKGASVTHMVRGGLVESEVIVSSKARWTVKSVSMVGNRTIVEVQED